MTTLWIRADGSASIGLGHVMRMIALGQAARRRGLDVRFVVLSDPVAVPLPRRFGFPVEELQRSDDLDWVDRVVPDDAVFTDGYHFTPPYLRALREATPTVGVMTDFPSGEFPVPVIVNQNPTHHQAYDHPLGASLLIGPRYALVRDEFVPHRRRHGGPMRRVLLTLGGSDVSGVGALLARRVQELQPQLEVIIVLGPAAGGVEVKRVEVVRDPPDLPQIFAAADLAITAAGSTTWELLFLGLPTVMIQVADNQGAVGPGVHRAGAGIFLGGVEDALEQLPLGLEKLMDPRQRTRLSAAALHLVDGHGSDRILDVLGDRSSVA